MWRLERSAWFAGIESETESGIENEFTFTVAERGVEGIIEGFSLDAVQFFLH